jgi:hypothetical protein
MLLWNSAFNVFTTRLPYAAHVLTLLVEDGRLLSFPEVKAAMVRDPQSLGLAHLDGEPVLVCYDEIGETLGTMRTFGVLAYGCGSEERVTLEAMAVQLKLLAGVSAPPFGGSSRDRHFEAA